MFGLKNQGGLPASSQVKIRESGKPSQRRESSIEVGKKQSERQESSITIKKKPPQSPSQSLNSPHSVKRATRSLKSRQQNSSKERGKKLSVTGSSSQRKDSHSRKPSTGKH